MHSTGLEGNECQKLPLTLSPHSPHLLQCTSLGQQVLWTLPFCCFSPGRLSAPALLGSKAVPSRMHSGLDGLVSCWQLLQPPWEARSLLGDTELRSHTGAPGLPPTAPEARWHWLATHTALVSPLPSTPGPPTPQSQFLLHTTDTQPDPLGTEPRSTEMNTTCLLTGVRGLPAFTFQ